MAVPPEKRLALLEQNHAIVVKRDDSLAREVSLKVTMGSYDDGDPVDDRPPLRRLGGRELNVAEDWTNAHLLRGRQRLASKQPGEALADFPASTTIPDNLPAAGRGAGGDHGIEAAFWTGIAYDALGDRAKAQESWTKAAAAPEVRAGRMGGGMMNAGATYYRALALQKLGRTSEMKPLLEELIRSAAQSLNSTDAAPSMANGRQSRQSRAVTAHYAAGLGYLGLGDSKKPDRSCSRRLAIDPAHVGARSALAELTR